MAMSLMEKQTRYLKTMFLIGGMALLTSLLLAADIVVPENAGWSRDLIYLVRLILTFGASWVIVSRVVAVLFRHTTLRLELTEWMIVVIPLLYLMLALVTAILGLFGLLFANIILVVCVLLAMGVAWVVPHNRIVIVAKCFGGIEKVIITMWLMIIVLGAAIYLPFTPGRWDTMAYHLYIPVRWLQENCIFHVPTVFGDLTPAFSPANAWAFNAAVMDLLNSDFLLNCVNLIFLGLLAAAIYRIMLHFVNNRLSAIAPASFIMLGPLFVQHYDVNAFSAYSDLPAQAMLFVALLFLLEYLRRPLGVYALLGALSCGICVGIKTGMIPYVLPVTLLLFGVVIVKRHWIAAFAAIPTLILGGGWWYFRNLKLYGNPLFPADITVFGHRLFAGPYALDCAHPYGYTMNTLNEFPGMVVDYFGLPLLVLTGSGLIGWGVGLFYQRQQISRLVFLPLIFVIWILAFVFINPYNAVCRFLFLPVIIGIAGNAFLIDRLKNDLLKALVILPILAGFSLINLVLLLNDIPFPWYIPGILWLLLMAFALFFIMQIQRSRWQFMCGALLCLMVVLFAGKRLSVAYRDATLALGDIGDYEPALRLVNKNSYPNPPLTIAYAGANIPYALVGPQMRNRVIYCSVSGPQNSNSYDYWLRYGKKTYSYAVPLYREVLNREIWFSNLNLVGANLLVLTALEPNERARFEQTAQHFTIEKTWAESNPEIFIPIVTSKSCAIFQINREALKLLLDIPDSDEHVKPF